MTRFAILAATVLLCLPVQVGSAEPEPAQVWIVDGVVMMREATFVRIADLVVQKNARIVELEAQLAKGGCI